MTDWNREHQKWVTTDAHRAAVDAQAERSETTRTILAVEGYAANIFQDAEKSTDSSEPAPTWSQSDCPRSVVTIAPAAEPPAGEYGLAVGVLVFLVIFGIFAFMIWWGG